MPATLSYGFIIPIPFILTLKKANQSFLGFTQSPQKTPKQEFSGGLFLFVQVIPRFSFKVRFDFCKIFVSLEFQSKTRKFRLDGGGVKT